MFKKGDSKIQRINFDVEKDRSFVDIYIESQIRKMWRDLFNPMLKGEE